MMAAVRGIIGVIIVFSVGACGSSDLKGQGQECFGSTECEPGLTCDLGQSPAVCAPNQTLRPDAAVDVPLIDADVVAPDAEPPLPDGDPGAVSLAIAPTPNQGCGTDPAGLLAGQGSACASYTVTNTGGLTSAALGVALSDLVNFEIATDTCTGAILATDATCTIAIGHRPQDLAATNATLTVSEASVPDLTRTLSGTAISALSTDTLTVDFADTTVGDSTAGPLMTLTNAANTPTTGALTVTLVGANAGEFSVASTCDGATVVAAGTCTVTVSFVPTAVAAGNTATVEITDGTANKTVSIALTGNGI